MVTVTKNRFLVKAEEVISAIQEQLRKSKAAWDMEPTPEQLEVVLLRVEAMKRQIQEDSAPPRTARYRRLSRMLVDEWPLGHPLATAVSELEDLYLKA